MFKIDNRLRNLEYSDTPIIQPQIIIHPRHEEVDEKKEKEQIFVEERGFIEKRSEKIQIEESWTIQEEPYKKIDLEDISEIDILIFANSLLEKNESRWFNREKIENDMEKVKLYLLFPKKIKGDIILLRAYLNDILENLIKKNQLIKKSTLGSDLYKVNKNGQER